MSAVPDPLSADWLGACRRSSEALRAILADAPTTAQRAEETGTRGRGGDRTLRIDEAAEAAVFRELDALHAEGHRFTAISEERGRVDFGDPDVRVVIDPIDGSLNAKRGLPHHAISIAVALGPTMADVVFGYVRDLGPDEEWTAWRDRGAQLDGRTLDRSLGEQRRHGRLEVLGLESADPRWIAEAAAGIAERAHRIRALGTIAISLCQVAAARFDAMVSLRSARAVDTAAAQLIVREAGGHVSFPGCGDPLGCPLDVEPHSPVVAARTPEAVAELAPLVGA